MRKLIRKRYGSASKVCSLVSDAEVPEISAHPKAEEVGIVVVKVIAAAMSPADYRLVEGWLSLVVSEKMPAGLGLELSGVVVKTSSDKFEVGDEVFGELEADESGAFADFCACAETSLAKKPSNISHIDAAALPVAAIVLGALSPYVEKIRDGKILVLGGSAATGAYICQLCRNVFGAKYIAATSSKIDFCRTNGCDTVYNYKLGEKWWETTTTTKESTTTHKKKELADFDIVFDCVGGDSWQEAHDHLPSTSTFVTFVPVPEGPLTVTRAVGAVGATFGRGIATTFGIHCSWAMVMAQPNATNLQQVADYLQNHKIKPLVDTTYDFTLPNVITMLDRQKQKLVKGRQICTIHTESQATELKESLRSSS